MIMCVLLCYPVSIRTYYQQGVLFLVIFSVVLFMFMKFTRSAKLSEFCCVKTITILTL